MKNEKAKPVVITKKIVCEYCGATENVGNFCPKCGKKQSEEVIPYKKKDDTTKKSIFKKKSNKEAERKRIDFKLNATEMSSVTQNTDDTHSQINVPLSFKKNSTVLKEVSLDNKSINSVNQPSTTQNTVSENRTISSVDKSYQPIERKDNYADIGVSGGFDNFSTWQMPNTINTYTNNRKKNDRNIAIGACFAAFIVVISMMLGISQKSDTGSNIQVDNTSQVVEQSTKKSIPDFEKEREELEKNKEKRNQKTEQTYSYEGSYTDTYNYSSSNSSGSSVNNSKSNTSNVSSGPTVWITKSGGCYHKTNNCGNTDLSAARAVSLSEAKSMSMDPCNNCYK